MAERPIGPRDVEVSFNFPHGPLPTELRAALVDEARRSDFRRFWLNEAVLINTGAGGAPAFSVDLIVTVAEGVASGVLTVGLLEAVKRGFRILRRTHPERVLRVKVGDRPSVYYRVSGDIDLDEAFESIPEDYERTVTTEAVIRRWSGGRWEILETRREASGPMKPPPGEQEPLERP